MRGCTWCEESTLGCWLAALCMLALAVFAGLMVVQRILCEQATKHGYCTMQ
jgi:hypothetical protein